MTPACAGPTTARMATNANAQHSLLVIDSASCRRGRVGHQRPKRCQPQAWIPHRGFTGRTDSVQEADEEFWLDSSKTEEVPWKQDLLVQREAELRGSAFPNKIRER